MLKLKKSLFFTLFLVFFGGSTAFGYFPDSVKGGFGVNYLPCDRFNSEVIKPLIDSIGGNIKYFRHFIDSISFHTPIIAKKEKKINRFFYLVIDKPHRLFYDVSIRYRQLSSCIDNSLSIIANYRQFKGDRNMVCRKDGIWVFEREDEEKMDFYLDMAFIALKELLFCQYSVGKDKSWEKAAEVICMYLESHIKEQPPIEGDIREFLENSLIWGKHKKRGKNVKREQ